MDGQKKPKMKVIGKAQKVETDGKVAGVGPVDNMGQYADRKEQDQKRPVQINSRPGGNTFPSGGQRPAQNNSQRPGTPGSPAQQGNQFQPSKGIGSNLLGSMLGMSGQQNSSGSGNSSHSNNSLLGSMLGAGSQQSGGNSSHSSNNSGKGGGSKLLLLLVIAALAIFVFPKLLNGGNNPPDTQTGGNTNTGGSSILSSVLGSFLGSSSTSTYDFSGGNMLSSMMGISSSSNSNFNFSGAGLSKEPELNRTVAEGARNKFVNVAKAKDVTVLVYMCGTDLESQSGMATADVQEMIKAGIGDNVNLLIYTGGCKSWRNRMFSPTYNQIYKIEGNNIECKVQNANELVKASDYKGSMTDYRTLVSFIKYGYDNYKADRMCLIFWDHGGGSVSGYGYDEKAGGRGQSMTLANIKTALESSVNSLGLKDKDKFDFIGFDACLMATVENGLMLSNYADYMIASEETEPGVGWYYTNWLKKLSNKPSMATIEVGKNIADDFVEVCAQQCRGQATTLSVVDLAELGKLLPDQLREFSTDTAGMIRNKNEYKTVATARSKTKEFAQSSGIDQIDLYDFAERLGTDEGNELKAMIKSAVKYNRTGGGVGNAHGLSIYFPYKKAGNVRRAVSTYQEIDMDDEYTRCIQAFASLEASGQVAAIGDSYGSYYGGGTQQQAFPGLMDSLLGGGSGAVSSSAYGGNLSSMIDSMIGGGSGASLFDLLGDRTITEEEAAEYVNSNHIDDSAIVWNGNTVTLPGQMDMITSVAENLFIRENGGYLDMGMMDKDNIRKSGDSLNAEFDQTWFGFTNGDKIINVAYYFMYETDNGGKIGYVPAMMTDEDHPADEEHPDGTYVRLIIYTDEDGNSTIAGAQIVYPDEDNFGVEAKNAIVVGKGTKLQFICSKYDDQFNYISTYRIKNGEIVIDDNTDLGLAEIGGGQECKVAWCMTDIYQNRHWTPSKVYISE